MESGMFYTDSFNFTEGIMKTGVAHPPGYIGYVTACRLLKLITGSPHSAMLAFNLLATFVISVTLYFLGRRLTNSTAASSAAMTALFMFNPFTYYYGEVSLSYITEAMTSILTATFCWYVMKGRKWAIFASAISLALGGRRCWFLCCLCGLGFIFMVIGPTLFRGPVRKQESPGNEVLIH
jgi:4-amino-4-deoxy-L-arabinose transferase-like glycosyltransferase